MAPTPQIQSLARWLTAIAFNLWMDMRPMVPNPTQIKSTPVAGYISVKDVREGSNRELGDYGCKEFAADYHISVPELVSLNPWLTGDCNAALYASLTETATRYLCIGTGVATQAPSSTFTESASPTTISAEGTPTGVVSGCQRFYTVQKGDDCTSIEKDFGISLAQFYSWNLSSRSSETLNRAVFLANIVW
jgi:hypothetical protein